MFQEKIIEYSPYLVLGTQAIALGLRLGQLGLEMTGRKDLGEALRVTAVGITTIGNMLALMDGGMILGIKISGYKDFFGDLASFTHKERVAAYIMCAVNSYFDISDKSHGLTV